MSYAKSNGDVIEDEDPIDSYFECVTACSLSGEGMDCITQCISIHLKEDLHDD